MNSNAGTGPDDEDTYPPGVNGIDVHRVLEPFARLEQVASEHGWGAVLRILADYLDGREEERRRRKDS
jgi:hypothetical protein